ncbi:type II toxin-antitoxin system RelE/ParE family toxin [Methylobacter sp. YRD-M1]|uniref:type II toxin-antitoxin system RelE/ParE family toxin n=1 Tax=Methylobacter sp. YRD-M1 TaxID=2911520 RepID=UPI00227B792A|nr:type II toxin-antitoxin system RelE/ParE family toxin [Methylobacter sp. YRD-M1]WAK04256.1 type II toxin-antitoxin system RelE/ParE family toxin [Methylobacter sp. YRD-M1]
MKRYTIIISPEAEQDIEDSYLYIKDDSPQNAMNWYREIYSKIQSLSSFPFRCPLAPENDFFPEEIRHLIIHNYRILYTTTGDTVYILHARHGSQEWLMPE